MPCRIVFRNASYLLIAVGLIVHVRGQNILFKLLFNAKWLISILSILTILLPFNLWQANKAMTYIVVLLYCNGGVH